jgi:hypothetical protein
MHYPSPHYRLDSVYPDYERADLPNQGKSARAALFGQSEKGHFSLKRPVTHCLSKIA